MYGNFSGNFEDFDEVQLLHEVRDMGNDNVVDERCHINLTYMFELQPFVADLSFYLCGPVLTCIIWAGVFGNALCLLIFCKTALRPRIYLYLIALTIWDISLLIMSFTLYSMPVLINSRVLAFGKFVPTYPLFYTLTNVAHSGSIWSVVVLAIERYFALCRPMKYITWDSETRVKFFLVAVLIFSVLFHLPKIFELKLHHCVDSDTMVDVPVMDSSELRENDTYKLFYKIIGGSIFVSVGPLLVLLVLTSRVSLEIRRNMVIQRKLSRRRRNFRNPLGLLEQTAKVDQKEDNKMDLMLVAVMVKFCLCHTLPMVLDVCEILMGENNFRVPLFEMLVDVSNVLVVLNSSCNLAIYFTFGVKFREAMKKLCYCKYWTRTPSDKRAMSTRDSSMSSVMFTDKRCSKGICELTPLCPDSNHA